MRHRVPISFSNRACSLGVPVYLPSFVNDCVIEGHYITSLGRYLATHGGDSEGVTIPAPVPAPAEQAAPRKGRRIRRAQFTPADVQITAGCAFFVFIIMLTCVI